MLLVQCLPGERWAGLWDFPRFQVQPPHALPIERQLAQAVGRRTGVSIRVGPRLDRLKHSVTRFRITLDCYEAEYLGPLRGVRPAGPQRWLCPADLARYPLSTTGRKLAKLGAAQE